MLGGHSSFLCAATGGRDVPASLTEMCLTEGKENGKVGHIDIVCYFNC